MSDRDVRIGILTCSTECAHAERPDELGQHMVDACEERGWIVVAYHVCENNAESVATSLIEMAEADEVCVVLTLGGVGLSRADVTPDATARVCERMVPGIAEAVRAHLRQTDPSSMMSRATAGIRGHTLVVNLPGEEDPARAAFEFMAGELEHAVDAIQFCGGIVLDE